MSVGSVEVSADAIVGISGQPLRVWNITWLSGGGGAGVMVLRNGTTASGAVYVQQPGSAASVTTTLNFEGGLLFPGGCFFDKDTNVASAVVGFEQLGY